MRVERKLESLPERQSLSAHPAAKPQRDRSFFPEGIAKS
jgi:hypothetical protein